MIEYLTIDVGAGISFTELEPFLNDIGRDGWKPAFQAADGSQLCFWREKRERSAHVEKAEVLQKKTKLFTE